MGVKEVNKMQAAERLRRLANQSFSETEIEINVKYEKSIKNQSKMALKIGSNLLIENMY